MKTKKLTLLSVFLSLSIVLSIVESFLTFNLPFLKLGLANIITLVILYKISAKDAFFVLLLRIFIVNVLLGHFFDIVFWMSLSGGLLAFVIMFLSKKSKLFSIVGVSISGAVGHIIGQLLAASYFIAGFLTAYYFSIFLLIGLFTGLFTGLTAKRIIKNFNFGNETND